LWRLNRIGRESGKHDKSGHGVFLLSFQVSSISIILWEEHRTDSDYLRKRSNQNVSRSVRVMICMTPIEVQFKTGYGRKIHARMDSF
jgi:hypothetical protein